MYQPPQSKGVPNMGKTNVIPHDDWVKVAEETVDKIIDILIQSCGPAAKFNLVIMPEFGEHTQSLMDNDSFTSGPAFSELNIFSKDGAHSVSSMKFGNEVQEYVKNIILYVGRNVDLACGDGTTTSMLIAAVFLKELFKLNLSNYTTSEIQWQYRENVQSIMHVIRNQNLITADSLNQYPTLTKYSPTDIQYAIAYMQAFTSSHREPKTAKVFADAFSQVDKQYLNSISILHPEYELEEPISLQVSESEFEDNCVFNARECLNADNKRKYENKDCTVLNFPEGIPDAGIMSQELITFLMNAREREPNTTVVLIAPAIGSSLNQVFANNNVKLHEGAPAEEIKFPEVICVTQITETSRQSHVAYNSVALSAVMNRPITFDPTKYTLEDFAVRHAVFKYDGVSKFSLDNVIAYPLDEASNKGPVKKLTHPGLDSPDLYPYYTSIRNQLLTFKLRSSVLHVKEQKELISINKALTMMETIRKISILTGGTTLSQLSMRLTAQDCANACIASIKSGFITHGLNWFAEEFEKYKSPTEKKDTSVETDESEPVIDLPKVLMNALAAAFRFTQNNLQARHVHDKSETGFMIVPPDYVRYIGIDLHESPYAVEIPALVESLIEHKNKNDTEWLLETIRTQSVAPIQPIRLYEELFKRLEEIILPMVSVSHVVIPNQLWDIKEQPNG